MFPRFALHNEEWSAMLKLISNLVAKRTEKFSETEFLAYLGGSIPKQARKEIIRASSELKLIKTLSGEDLVKPLERRSFPKRKLYELLCVLHNTIIGARLESLFNPHQKLYLAAFFLHSHRAEGHFVEVSDEAISLVLKDVLAGKVDREVGDRFTGFLFSLCKPVSDWKQLDACSYFALLGILLLLLSSEQHDSADFHIILEYLFFHRILNAGFTPQSHSEHVVEDWRSLAESALTNAPDFRDAVTVLLPA
jgi:hypothetical protein